MLLSRLSMAFFYLAKRTFEERCIFWQRWTIISQEVLLSFLSFAFNHHLQMAEEWNLMLWQRKDFQRTDEQFDFLRTNISADHNSGMIYLVHSFSTMKDVMVMSKMETEHFCSVALFFFPRQFTFLWDCPKYNFIMYKCQILFVYFCQELLCSVA